MIETPNGAFPNYVEEQTETHKQYLERIFHEWLEWAEGSTQVTNRLRQEPIPPVEESANGDIYSTN